MEHMTEVMVAEQMVLQELDIQVLLLVVEEVRFLVDLLVHLTGQGLLQQRQDLH